MTSNIIGFPAWSGWYKIVTKYMVVPGGAQEGTILIPEHTLVTDLIAGHATEDCRAVAAVLARVGDKWTILVVVLLGDGPRRFNEMKRLIGGISQRMLTLTLRGLERDGMVKRTVFPTVPPRVDYELTALGCSLREAVEVLLHWSKDHIREIAEAQAQFDQP